MRGAVKPLTVSYAVHYGGRNEFEGTLSDGETTTIDSGWRGIEVKGIATFTCSGGNDTYTYTLTKIDPRSDDYITVSQSENIFTVIMGDAMSGCSGKYKFIITSGDESVTFNLYYELLCLTGDALITLADGTQKRIDELTLSDKVLSYNPSTMQLEADEITYTDSKENKSFTEYTKYIFSDNTEIKTVHRHRFYNMERQAMIHMDEWEIGEHAIKQDGTVVELISSELIKETVKHYTIFTKNQNYFANGLLSGNRHTESMHFEVVD